MANVPFIDHLPFKNGGFPWVFPAVGGYTGCGKTNPKIFGYAKVTQLPSGKLT